MNGSLFQIFNLDDKMTAAAGGQRVIKEWIIENLTSHPDRKKTIFVGTDSQNRKRTHFTTALIVYREGRGGNYLYSRYSRSKIENLHQKLSTEAWNSIYLALEVVSFMETLPKKLSDGVEVIVHLDISSKIKFEKHPSCKSGQYMNELIGCVVSQGLKCQIKPGAFSASFVCDKIVKSA